VPVITMVGREEESPITIDLLARSIANSMREISLEEAHQLAEHILNFFGYGDRIIDNILEQDDRNLFYLLEDLGLIYSEREETTLHDGREWRIHYWVMNTERIREAAERVEVVEEEEPEDTAEIYEELPEEIWYSRPEEF